MLEYLLATPAPTPAAESTTTVGLDGGAIWALLLAPTFVAALVSAIVTLVAPFVFRKLRRSEATEAAARELNVRALNEFYSPIRELLSEVKILRDEINRRVNRTNDANWHTLDHVREIRKDPVAWALFGAMVKANERIKQLLDEKSGLARGAVTASGLWRVHQSLLARALAKPTSVPSTELSYFPVAFESQINAKFEALSAELDAHSVTDKKNTRGKNS